MDSVLFTHFMKGKKIKNEELTVEDVEAALRNLVQTLPVTQIVEPKTSCKKLNELMFQTFHQLAGSAYMSLLEESLCLEKENQSIKKLSDDESRKYAIISEDLSEMNLQYKEVQVKNQTLEQNMKELSGKKAQLEEKLLNYKQQLKTENEKVAKINKENAKLTLKIQQLEQELKDNHQCRKCAHLESELSISKEMCTNLQKKIEKCAFVANSSMENPPNLLTRLHSLLSPSTIKAFETSCDTVASDHSEEEERPVLRHGHSKMFGKIDGTSSQRKVQTNADIVLASESICLDDDMTVLPDSDSDASFLHPNRRVQKEILDDNVRFVPETVPLDLEEEDHHLISTEKFFQSKKAPYSPVLGASKSTANNKSVTPVKKNAEPANALDESYCSPTIFELAPEILGHSRPALKPMTNNTATAAATCEEEDDDDFPKRKLFQDVADPSKPNIKKRDPSQPHLPPPAVPAAKKGKSLKQTTLSEASFKSSTPVAAQGAQRPRIAMKIAPPNEYREPKRRKRGKEPEDWECKECYRLLKESEAKGKIDRRKHEIAMNFCSEHFNRNSYYLSTPPTFWDCNKMAAPRNGHLHPLDVSDDDDDFVKP